MRYVFIDDTPLAYDAYTPMRRPLGGAEKAVGGLAAALKERGHDVNVINNVAYAHMADGAYWTPFGDSMAPKAADVLIALRKPALLGTLRAATHRLLWVLGEPSYLKASVNTPLWDSFQASLLFIGHAQHRAYGGSLRSAVVAPGVRSAFYEKPQPPTDPSPYLEDPNANPGFPYAPAPERQEPEVAHVAETVEDVAVRPPHAIVTTHPLQGLAWVVEVWVKLIHPKMPDARLSIYSAVLNKGLRGEEIPANIVPVLEFVKSAAAANVVVVEPRGDDGMAEVYRASRVHLYPGDAKDYACWTLSESHAAGLPAVARNLGGVGERINNAQSGYIVPDAAAFANVALQILGNEAVYKTLNAGAASLERRRTWALAAHELDDFVATLPVMA